MNALFEPYLALLGPEVIGQLEQTAVPLKGIKIVHVNSTREGGGVAEILTKMVPLTNALGIETKWEVLKGDEEFFQITKNMHNLLQGMHHAPFPTPANVSYYEKIVAGNAEELRGVLENADIVFVHDPQPLPLITHFPKRKGKWIWRCHIDVSYAPRAVWKIIRKYLDKYDASIFSLEDFVRPLPHPIYLITPSIDPLSEKNIELDPSEVSSIYSSFGIDTERPTIVQISRFDRFKDPLGDVRAYYFAKKYFPSLQFVYAGGGATDDPESTSIYQEVKQNVENDPDVHILFLPPAARTINALQRGADIVLQKSIREGFGLTVTEALWKAKPVIGGNTGGIKLQVFDHFTGFRVNTPEGAALRIRHLLQNPNLRKEFGQLGRKLVKENFLITRHLREYLTLMATLLFPHENGDRIDLSRP